MLEARHPLAKLAAAIVLVVAASLIERLPGLAVIAAVTVAALLAEGCPLFRLLRRLVPFMALAGAMSWIYLVADDPSYRAVGGSGAWTAALVAARILTMALVSLAFAETTRADDLARALEQNAGLPRRTVQGVLAAIQFLPALAEDYGVMRMSERSRHRGPGLKARLGRATAGLSPDLLLILLAGAIRRAGAAALSMQLRGLTAATPASSWHRRPLRAADAGLVLASLGTALAAAATALP